MALQANKFSQEQTLQGNQIASTKEISKKTTGLQQANQLKDATQNAANAIKLLPNRIAEYDKVISALEKKPELINTGTGKALLNSMGLDIYGISPEENIVKSALQNIQMSRIASFRGLGSMSDRDMEAMAAAEPSLFQTPQGMIAVAKGKKFIDLADLEFAKEYQKIQCIWFSNSASS